MLKNIFECKVKGKEIRNCLFLTDFLYGNRITTQKIRLKEILRKISYIFDQIIFIYKSS